MTTEPQKRGTPGKEGDALDRALVGGLAWTAGLKWAVQLFSWATTLVVARLLLPADYGLVSMATVLVGLIQLLGELGLGAVIIQRRDLAERMVTDIAGVCLAAGACLGVAAAAVSPLAARFYGEPSLVPVIVAYAPGFMVAAVRVMPYSLLSRDMAFQRLAVIGLAEAGFTSLLTLVLAAAGFGYWSLVAGNLIGQAVGCALLVRARRYRVTWPHSFAELAPVLGFGASLVGSRIAWYAYSNADFAIVGRLLGKSPLGNYNLAWQFASLPVDKITAVMGQVTPAIFASVQHDPARLRRYLLGLSRALALVTFPLSFGLAVSAPEFVGVVLGPNWSGATGPLRLLALAAAVRSVSTTFHQILIAQGRATVILRITTLGAILLPLLFLAGTRWGIVGVAGAWAMGHPLFIALPSLWACLRTTETTLGHYAVALSPAFTSALIMALGVYVLRRSMLPLIPVTAMLTIEVAAGAALYALSLLVLHRQVLRETVDFIRRLRQPVAQAA